MQHPDKPKSNQMQTSVTLNTICIPSENVVARLIEDEMVIVPLVAGIGDVESGLYTLNPTGQAIWHKLDGHLTLKEVATLLVTEFDAPLVELENDVVGFAGELVRRSLLLVIG